MVTIDSGSVEATYKFDNTPRAKWHLLLIAKKSFLKTRLNHDCRCLIEFCEEAELVYADLGFASAEEMIRHGYELDPSQVSLAVAWLKANSDAAPVGMADLSKKIAEAKERPLETSDQTAKPRNPNGRSGKESVDNVNRLKGGNETEYTLRRLARDAPAMLDKIESGELSVNAAAIAAGIRKKPSQAEIAVKAFKRAENRLEAMRMMIDTLEPFEVAIVRDWAMERLS